MGIRDDLGRFRRRSTKETQVNRDLSLLFLKNSPSSTFVVLQKTNRKIDALVVSSYKEGPNELLLFTKNNLSDSAQNAFIGDYITYDNKTYLIFDEFDHPDFADYKKHKMIECNVQFGYDSKKFDAFYMGSRRKLDTLETSQTMRSVSLIGDPNHPLLIASNQPDVKLRKRIMIAGDV
jgi:hypothetical protein